MKYVKHLKAMVIRVKGCHIDQKKTLAHFEAEGIAGPSCNAKARIRQAYGAKMGDAHHLGQPKR